MKIRFDFVIHWLWTIVFSLLTLSGIAMLSPRYGWVLNYDIGAADISHRVLAAIFVILTALSIGYEIIRAIRNDNSRLAWFVIGKSGYQLFTYITTLIFIITGAIIWICMDSNMAATAFALYVHEKLTYIAVISVIWHIYVKCHALIWPKKVQSSKTKSTVGKN